MLINFIHTIFAFGSLAMIARIDAKQFEISPQFVIIAAINIFSLRLGIGHNLIDIFIAVLITLAGLGIYMLVFAKRSRGISPGDLYLIPILGLAVSFDYLIAALLALAAAQLVYTYFLSRKRGKRFSLKSGGPLGPSFCLVVGIFLALQLWRALITEIPIGANSYSFILFVVSWGISGAALVWMFFENRSEVQFRSLKACQKPRFSKNPPDTLRDAENDFKYNSNSAGGSKS